MVEYFGVGPDKVVDIQALAGDSTDNVPGAPGIGVKTAAQLIAEYGDLETLLARAGEIKQPKRREALTDPQNVERIRISKQLVTLVRDVAVETPLDALALPQLDGKRLLAFLKAMEFTTLTRRVAEICGVEASSVEPDPRFVGPGGLAQRDGGQAEAPAPAAPTPPAAALRPRHRPPRRQATPESAPADLVRARAAEARAPIDRSLTRPCGRRRSLPAGSPARRPKGVVAVDTETTSLDPMQAELIGLSLAVRPGEACYVPLGHRVGADDLFGGGALVEGRSPKRRRWRC